MTKIKNTKLVLLACLFFTMLMNYVQAKAETKKKLEGLSIHDIVMEKHWTEKNVKNFLKLPYDKKFGKNKLIISIDQFHDFDGVKDFALISDMKEFHFSNNKKSVFIGFKVSSPDLSVFSIYIYNPVSCKEACKDLKEALTGRISMLSKIHEIYLPQHNNDDENVYTILNYTDRPQKWYLNTKLGIYIYVRFDSSSRRLKEEIPNNYLLIKQIDLIINGLVSFLDGKYNITDKQKAEYKKIQQEYKTAKEELRKKRDATRATRRARQGQQHK